MVEEDEVGPEKSQRRGLGGEEENQECGVRRVECIKTFKQDR